MGKQVLGELFQLVVFKIEMSKPPVAKHLSICCYLVKRDQTDAEFREDGGDADWKGWGFNGTRLQLARVSLPLSEPIRGLDSVMN